MKITKTQLKRLIEEAITTELDRNNMKKGRARDASDVIYDFEAMQEALEEAEYIYSRALKTVEMDKQDEADGEALPAKMKALNLTTLKNTKQKVDEYRKAIIDAKQHIKAIKARQ